MTRFLLALAAPVLLLACSPAGAQSIPAPAADSSRSTGIRTAVFAGGCFWGVEGVFEHVEGVREVVSGYAGGKRETASYAKVNSKKTGHAEAVLIRYDSAQISYGKLLHILFAVAMDPTQLNRQGPDVGPQYRSAIFPQDEEQARIARAYIAQLGRARAFDKPIVTRLESGRFYRAEPVHQDFMRRNPNHLYIQVHDMPKLAALKRRFPSLYRG